MPPPHGRPRNRTLTAFPVPQLTGRAARRADGCHAESAFRAGQVGPGPDPGAEHDSDDRQKHEVGEIIPKEPAHGRRPAADPNALSPGGVLRQAKRCPAREA